jgi:HD superfamily phosphohydrolase YqeK
MSDGSLPLAGRVVLPQWARVSEKRRAHIERVTALLVDWAATLGIPGAEAAAWRDAGRWHDALRDADEAELRRWAGTVPWPLQVLHGPAAAARLEHEGEQRMDVLEAVRWHTLGRAGWARTGRALYMADFLEPGRTHARDERATLARSVPGDFDGVFRQVVQLRRQWTLTDGKPVFPETAALWNEVE